MSSNSEEVAPTLPLVTEPERLEQDENANENTIDESNESEIIYIQQEEEEDDSTDDETSFNEALQQMAEQFSKKLGLMDEEKRTKLPKDMLNLEGIAKGIKDGIFKNIIIMSGAGISVAAGIPDFRTPGTGLYSQLEKYKLDEPTDIFTLSFFRQNPEPFNLLARGMFPGLYRPTLAHYFGVLLNEKKLLLRNYTQNIDTLERVAGLPGEKLVEAHGSFKAAHCIDCDTEMPMEQLKKIIMEEGIPKCEKCGSLVKPDIVFFGESLPDRFFELANRDFELCDLLIVMGTSLTVQPFAGLINRVNDDCVRLLINREEVGVNTSSSSSLIQMLMSGRVDFGFKFNSSSNTRDAKWLGDIETGITEFAKLLGWEEELTQLATEPLNKL